MKGDFSARLDAWAAEPIWQHRWAIMLSLVAASLPLFIVVTTPLALSWQAIFGLGCFLGAVWLNRQPGRLVTLMLMVLSVLVSTRYIYWRLTESVHFGGVNRGMFDNFFAIGLIGAELYAYMVLILGYFQVLWPLQRKPSPMPRDSSTWPTVDVYIPTYNEPLKVVRPTIFAAMSLDWPRDKINVYVLDDGRREEFRKFCEDVGVTHITRNDSKHAKAGNLNRAMQKTHGEYVAIFDCDHVPTRSFLQITVGWFLKDTKLGMLQTPHHFFSPDPFERNLHTFRQVPNEGELFYGLLQDGNDFWNATFFCGSCAVLRRSALDEVKGIAIETVTEDAHTSLKMHRKGWNTAYINLAQAAGLATESLSAHVGQRIRWARGMAQIFRTDNPLFGKGLHWGQRLCYFNAMMHFFYGLPRIVFLTAPLSYLFFEAHIIEASALMILAYAGPHIAHANLTNSRVQGPFRHSFWAEVYETVLATYILLPTTLALINPKLGTFNVTAKGGLVENEFFDRTIARPYLWLMGLNLVGLAVGIGRLLWWNTHELDTVVLNMLWTIFNLIIVGAATAVAWESRQIRNSIRISAKIPALVRLGPGLPEMAATTIDLSEGGTGLQLNQAMQLPHGSQLEVALLPEFQQVWMPARVTRSDGATLAMRFESLNVAQEKQLIYALFGRADAWVRWADGRAIDSLPDSLREVTSVGIAGSLRIVSMGFAVASGKMKTSVRKVFGRFRVTAPAAGLLAGGLLAAAMLHSQPALAQGRERLPVPEPVSTGVSGTLETDVSSTTRPGLRRLTFQDLGVQRPIRLRGVQGEVGIPLAIRDDETVKSAKLTLRFSHSPSLIFSMSHINVLVNNELAATIPLTAETAGGAERVVDIDPRLLVGYNQIGLQMIAHYTIECEDPINTTLWSIVSNSSTLELDTRPLELENDLRLLPRPFFDAHDARKLTLPFVFNGTPGPAELEAAGVIASWFGALAAYRGASFPVYINRLPMGNAVVFSVDGRLPDGLPSLAKGSSAVSLTASPISPGAKLLVVSGSDGAGLNLAARAVALQPEALSGETATIRDFELPPPREPYDAPRWIATDRPVRVGDLVTPPQLEVSGLYPDTIRVPFHVPPDLFTWRGEGLELDLKYRYTPTVGSKSTLNVNVNGEFVQAIALSYTGEEKAAEERINLPFVAPYTSVNQSLVHVPDYKLSSDNTLALQYYFERKKEGACKDVVLDNLRGVVDEDSTLDLSAFPHYTRLPELSLFANGGFPFTRYADLAETAVILPDSISADEATAYLTIMGRLGSVTGYPATRFKLGRAAEAESYAGMDLLVFGTAASQPLLRQWADDMPMAYTDGGGARLRVIGPIERLRTSWEGRDADAVQKHAGRVILDAGRALGVIMSFESPYSSGRTVVVFAAGEPKRLREVADILGGSGKSQFVRGDLVLLNGSELNHYVFGGQYSSGRLPLVMGLRWWFSQQPVLLVGIALIAALLLALLMYSQLRRRAISRKDGHA